MKYFENKNLDKVYQKILNVLYVGLFLLALGIVLFGYSIFKSEEVKPTLLDDIIVNNAGVCYLENFETMSDELRDTHFDINIKGTWNVTKAALPYLKKNTSSSIVNLSSVTGVMVADSGEVAYATTKAALMGFTKALASEVVADHIRVNAILPGYIRTPMVDGMAKTSNPSDPESVVAGIANAIPMKRLGTIEELGELAAFLASEDPSYITAQGKVIDGGSTLQETNSMGV